MCGRFTSTTPPPVLADVFSVENIALDDDLEPRWNVAPTLPVLAVAESRSTGARKLGTFRWGLVPSWAPDLSVGAKMINARAETVATKPAFRDALRRRRCIIPADAFYEWKAGGGGARQPYAVARRDGQPLAFAGLWAVWRDPNVTAAADQPEAPPVRTCVIVTTEANELLAPVHHRMPVVLPPSAWDAWLDPANDDVDELRQLLVPAPAEDFVTWPVATLVNKATNEGPQLIEVVDLEEDRLAGPEALELDLFAPAVDD